LIYLQCDDGNRLDGDGCSSNCLIETGWNCTHNSSGEFCDLLTPPALKDFTVTKQFGINEVKIEMGLSIGIRISAASFTVTISGMNGQQFSYGIRQR
jgi:hypothetical protein